MATNKIEQLIEDIYEFVESCKMQPFSTTKVIVPKDELYDLLDELRLSTPAEITKYKKVLVNRDAIFADAEKKANDIINNADNRALSMINEHEIMQKAYDQANEMVSKATAEADRLLSEANYESNQIRTSSLTYTEDLLNSVETLISNTLNQSSKDYEVLTNNLKSTLELINDNKQELAIPDNEEDNQEEEYQDDFNADSEEYEEYEDYEEFDDYDFDEDTFLKDID